MKRFAERYPRLYFVTIGVMGGVIIVIGIDVVLSSIGGVSLVRKVGLITLMTAFMWFWFHYSRVRSRLR